MLFSKYCYLIRSFVRVEITYIWSNTLMLIHLSVKREIGIIAHFDKTHLLKIRP